MIATDIKFTKYFGALNLSLSRISIFYKYYGAMHFGYPQLLIFYMDIGALHLSSSLYNSSSMDFWTLP
jgi:hypothetical protein